MTHGITSAGCWRYCGRADCRCRFRVLLAVIAMDYDAELWTYDAHFKVIQTITPKLKLFQGPTG